MAQPLDLEHPSIQRVILSKAMMGVMERSSYYSYAVVCCGTGKVGLAVAVVLVVVVVVVVVATVQPQVLGNGKKTTPMMVYVASYFV